MNLSRPATTLLSKLDAIVLSVLYRSERAATVREIHRVGGAGSYEGVRRALLRLASTGLLKMDERRAGTFYHLNRAHLAYETLESLLTMRARLIAMLEQAVQRWEEQPVHVSLFGSFARQEGDTGSDIDVLAVFEDNTYSNEALWADQVSELESAIGEWTGNTATVFALGMNDLRAMAKGKRAAELWQSVRADHVVVVGPALTELAS